MVNWGLTSCWGGFGENNHNYCKGLVSNSGAITNNDKKRRGILTYSPAESMSASEVVDELALLLTGGRLHDEAKITMINAYNAMGGGPAGLQIAQKLMVTAPEFHSTNVVIADLSPRQEVDAPPAPTKPYKAVVFLNLRGGCDSYNLLIPHSGCSGKDMYEHYKSVRGGLSVPKNDLLHIDASGSDQVCSTFGVHPEIPVLKSLYDAGELLWVSNMGIMERSTTKDRWWKDTTDTTLFAHNFQQREVQNMDIYESKVRTGIGGRMADALKRLGYNAGSVSMSGIVDALASDGASQIVVEPERFESFDPSSESPELLNAAKAVNSGTKVGSGLFGETWSSLMTKVRHMKCYTRYLVCFYSLFLLCIGFFFILFSQQGISQNDILSDSLSSVSLGVDFTADNQFSLQMEAVAKMMKTKDSRGAERDVFYVEKDGFDTHFDQINKFGRLLPSVNAGIDEFKRAMVAEGLWDCVTIVMVSEFGRTLSGNTGGGSDHGMLFCLFSSRMFFDFVIGVM